MFISKFDYNTQELILHGNKINTSLIFNIYSLYKQTDYNK